MKKSGTTSPKQPDRDSHKSFRWIIGVLRELNVPFQVSGGLAAKAYGSERDLNDIDLDIPDSRLGEVAERVKEFIVFGPARIKDERWDLMLMTLNHHGQEIDVGGAECRICDARIGEWVDATVDLSRAKEREVLGLRVPVIPARELMEYKSMLAGEHQKRDIKAVKKYLASE